MSQKFSAFEAHPTEPPPPGGPAIYTHPDEILSDPNLAAAERKALLASWISDARAVENAPTLRQLESGSVVEVDAILQALVSLDEQASHPTDEPTNSPPASRRRLFARWVRRSGRKNANDNGDDPPPAPGGFGIPFRPTFVATREAAHRQPRKIAIA